MVCEIIIEIVSKDITYNSVEWEIEWPILVPGEQHEFDVVFLQRK